VGRYRIHIEQLDSTDADEALWDPDEVSANAHRAVDDDTAIAYLGELDYGGSAVSLPITNNERLLQIAPLDGLTSLTRRPPGMPRAGPERYYPSEERTFLRLVPNDLRLADALIEQLVLDGARSVSVIYDESIYGRELAGQVNRRARQRGLATSGLVEDRDEAEDVDSRAQDIADERPDAVVYGGTPGVTFAALLDALRRELPGVPVWGGAGLAAAGARARAGAGVGARTAWLQPVRPPSRYPAPARRLLRRLGARPEGLYGYEAVRIVLDAIAEAGADRRAVARSALAPRERESPLGRYRVLRGGDISERRLALYELDGFSFERLVR
jgi:branched-chain amino acid transport system substrate-binding protein